MDLDINITDAIEKLELYRQQIKEQTKKEILNFVENRGDEYFKYMMEDAEDTDLSQINYRLKTVKDIENMINFLNFNCNHESLGKLLRDLHYYNPKNGRKN